MICSLCGELFYEEKDHGPCRPLAFALGAVRLLWRQPDSGALWGLPYEMRRGQSPYDLWRAEHEFVPLPQGTYGSKKIDLSDWVYLGGAGPYASKEDRILVEAFLDPLRDKDLIPLNSCEWTRLYEDE